MDIQFAVDQAAALRHGINAPSSLVLIDVDPSTLTQEDRDLLAQVATDGRHAKSPFYRGMAPYARVYTLPKLLRPDSVGLLEALDALRNSIAQGDAEVAKLEAVARQDATAACEAWLAEPLVERTTTIGLNSKGEETNVAPVVKGTAAWTARVNPHPNGWGYTSMEHRISPDIAQRVMAAIAAKSADQEEAVRREMARLISVDLPREMALREVATTTDRVLHTRLPAALLAREADGYATEKEIREAICAIAREDAGYPTSPSYQWGQNMGPVRYLTDAQHAALLAARRQAPQGAKIEAYQVWDHTDETPCDNHEEYYDECRACQRDYVGLRVSGIVDWKVGTYTIRAEVPLPQAAAE